MGGAAPVVLLCFEPAAQEGIVSVAAEDAPKLRSAAALLTSCRGRACRLELLAESPFLADLAHRDAALEAAVDAALAAAQLEARRGSQGAAGDQLSIAE